MDRQKTAKVTGSANVTGSASGIGDAALINGITLPIEDGWTAR